MKLSISNELTDSDFNSFIELFRFNISTYYPFSSELTAKSIVDTHKKTFDSRGYFTKKKTIWKLINQHQTVLGFSVVTEKRGGSIKFGPTIVVEGVRNKGYGSEFRILLENFYRDLGYRKAYLTTNQKNMQVVSYLVNLNYKIELHLRQHYTISSNEFVLSKFLNPTLLKTTASEISAEYVNKYGCHVVEYLKKYYDEIDDSFFSNLEKAISTDFAKSEISFINKTKLKFEFKEDKFFAISSPKRGGCVKLSPLVFSANKDTDKKNLMNIISLFDSNLFHKFYTFVPLDCLYDRCLLESCGFKVEGEFSSPYKNNVDMLIISLIRE